MTKPSFAITPTNTILDQCGLSPTSAGSRPPMILNFGNGGARAQNVVISYTLPAGFAYDGLAATTNPTPTVKPAIGATGTITWLYSVIATNVATPTLQFYVKNDPLAAGTCATAGDLTGNYRGHALRGYLWHCL